LRCDDELLTNLTDGFQWFFEWIKPPAFPARPGTRGGGRTHNLRLRRPTLYPIELLAQGNGQHTCARNVAQMEFAREIYAWRIRPCHPGHKAEPTSVPPAGSRVPHCGSSQGWLPLRGSVHLRPKTKRDGAGPSRCQCMFPTDYCCGGAAGGGVSAGGGVPAVGGVPAGGGVPVGGGVLPGGWPIRRSRMPTGDIFCHLSNCSGVRMAFICVVVSS
jgi:hypothetical protein